MAKHDRYSDEILEYVREHSMEYSIEEMAAVVTEKFGRKVNYKQMKSLFKNHKIHAKPRLGRKGKTKFPEGMDEYIREICHMRTHKEIAAMVNARFGEGTITPEQVHTYNKNHKIRTGRSGQFEKGMVPHNKGTHPETKGRMAETQFKKGNRPHNWRPVGSERISVDGYIEVKVEEPRKWKLKHRLIWEEKYGPIPENHIVTFKDGNKQNTDLSNLELIDRATCARMNKLGIMNPGVEAFDTAVAVARLAAGTGKLAREAKERRKRIRAVSGSRR